jgi:cytochrome c biogenesis protein CcmG/thiol:disulfide interchange protein DsbE
MRVRRWIKRLKFFLPTVLLISFFQGFSVAESFAKIPSDATAKTLDGKSVSIADYKGKLIFLNVWKSDCPPCLMEIPILKRLQKEYSSDSFTVIGLSVDRGKDEFVSELVKRTEINFPVWLGYGQPLIKYLEPPVTPFLLVLGPEGEVLGYIPGMLPSYQDAVKVMNQARDLVAEQARQK